MYRTILFGRENHLMQCFSSRKALFNGEGIFTSKAQCIEKGNFFGRKFLDWGFSKEKEKELVDGSLKAFLYPTFQNSQSQPKLPKPIQKLKALHEWPTT